MINIEFYSCNVRLFSSENKCSSAILMDIASTKNNTEWKQPVVGYAQYDVININFINI